MYASQLASCTSTIWKALEASGVDSRRVFEQAGLDPEKLYEPGARFRYRAVRRLFELALDHTQDPCLGLKLARYWHPSNLHALGYAWLASSDLKDALNRIIRYFRVVSTDKEELTLVETERGYRFAVDVSNVVWEPIAVEYDDFMASIVSMCRVSWGEALTPVELKIQRPRPPQRCVEEFARYFKAPVEFAAHENSLLFRKADLEKLLPTGNVQVARACDRIVDEFLAGLEGAQIMVKARAKLVERLPSGEFSEQDIAQALHISVRGLQRKLKKEGTTFRRLVDDTRHDLALQYIKDSTVSINEMAYLLGYSEHANFSRAFKRWTGIAPSAAR